MFKSQVLKRTSMGALLFCLTLASYFIPLIMATRFATSAVDWNYFNSFSLIIRTNILRFAQFPFHDPWIGGGSDLFANPQTRILSPFVLMDVLFPPFQANLISLVLYGFLGMIGMFLLLRHLKCGIFYSVVGAVLFINSNWFGRHFASGIIVYGSLQLLPFVLLSYLRIEKASFQLLLFSLLSLFILDGAIYTFCFSVFTVVTCLLLRLNELSLRKEVRRLISEWKRLAAFSAMLICFLGAKMLPVLLSAKTWLPSKDLTSVSPVVLGRIVGDPFLYFSGARNDLYRGFGYWGFVFITLVIVGFLWRDFRKENWKFGLAGIFWLYLASGWGAPLHPWSIFQAIPLLNSVHDPSRTLIIAQLFMVVFAVRLLDRIKHIRGVLVVTFFLLMESLIMKNFPFYQSFTQRGIYLGEPFLITSSTVERTLKEGEKSRHYFFENKGAKITYETMRFRNSVSFFGSKDYRGEVYFLGGTGRGSLDSFTPGQIKFSFQAPPNSIARINTNVLSGWKVAEGPGEVVGDKSGLPTVKVLKNQGSITLKYNPSYLPSVMIFYIFGLGIFFFYLFRLRTGNVR